MVALQEPERANPPSRDSSVPNGISDGFKNCPRLFGTGGVRLALGRTAPRSERLAERELDPMSLKCAGLENSVPSGPEHVLLATCRFATTASRLR